MLAKFIAKGLHVALVAYFFCALHSLAQEEDAESRHLFRCRDLNSQCLNWKRLCTIQSIKTMCRRTCGNCGLVNPKPVCRDTNTRCRSWERYCRRGQISDICPKTCNTCPDEEDGGWTKWNSWSNCDAECGRGEQFRTRQCKGRPNDCPGESREEQQCNIHDCPDSDCEDKETWCSGYRRFCRRPRVRKTCQKTCGQCNGGGGGGNNRCNPNPCQNEGVCSRVGNSYRCRCKLGYSGRNCLKASNPCDNEPCQNGGICQQSGTLYRCRCKVGYTGNNCDTTSNPCSSNPCKNDGTCRRSGTSYSCNCRRGFTGENCEIAEGDCKNRVLWCPDYLRQCTSNKIVRENCKKACGLCGKEEKDPCEEKPCQNDGTCVKTGSSYRCQCRTGHTGKNCETAEGDCKNRVLWCPDYLRLCTSNQMVRKNCKKACGLCGKEEDPCEEKPCQNDGTCVKSGRSYRCQCKTGYTGKNCETASNPCDSKPCKNGGTCTRSGGGFNCKCRPGHTGKLCETSISETCSPNPCQYGGSCRIAKSGAVKCKCAIGYSGDKCQTKLRIGVWSACSKPCDGGTRYRGEKCSENDVIKCPREYGDCNMQECKTVSCQTYRFGSRTQCCNPTSGGCGASEPRNLESRIIGGVTSKDAQWPWMAAVYYKPSNDFYCAATILNSRWMVTAGHCVNPYSVSNLRVLAGTNRREKPEAGHKWYDIERKVLHPTFDNPIDDVGLIKSRSTILFSRDIKPACLPNGEQLEQDTICFAAGWGVAFIDDLKTRTPSDVIKHVGLRTLPLDACVQGYRGVAYARGINSKIICSGLLGGGKDTCLGDSGGALICQRKNSCEWYVAGTTSFGASECAVGNIPGGYMDMAHYETWINGYINT